MAVVVRDNFERFIERLYGEAKKGGEGAAALPTTISETVRALNPRALESLARSTLATTPFLSALEESMIPGTSLRYVLVHDEIGPAGFMLMTVVQLDLSMVVGDAAERLSGSSSRSSSRSSPRTRRQKTLQAASRLLQKTRRKDDPSEARILMGGHPLFWGNHFFNFRDPGPTPSLTATLARAGYRIRKNEGITVSLLKDFPNADLPLLAPLERYGYVRFETEPNMILKIDPRWKNFGHYLTALSARYRKRIQDRKRALESSGVTLEPARPTPIAAELAELYSNVWHRSTTRLVRLTPSFFRAVEAHLRDAFRLWVVKKDRRIIAFVCAIEDRMPKSGRNRLMGLFVGLDYSENQEHRVYWNLLYKLVEEAISGGFEILDLGRTALQAKAELGAQPEHLHCFIRHRNPTANALMRVVFEQLIQPATAPRRHALKE